MLQNRIKIIEICSGKKNSATATFPESLQTTSWHFHHRPQKQLTDTRLEPLESRSAALPGYYESEASKPPESALYR